MIKYNNKTINDWYFDNKNVIKVYKNNAVCYYKIVSDGGTPSQEPCFAVVNDITQYSDTEFIDVYDKATEKWYKLNNLDQYEQYGVYGEGRNITYYVGKLTIDEGYEYEWDGSEWDNLGEVSGSSVPDSYVIPFADSTVKSICVTNWGGNVVAGEITYGEAKQVTSIGNVFQRQTTITSFNELAYFHGLTSLVNGEFVGCTSLRDIVIPSNVTSIGYNNTTRPTFSGCTSLSGLTILSGDETLTMDLFSNRNSYYMNSSHSNIPMCFPDRIMTFGTGTFGYCNYLTQAYFQNATPPVGLANADINNYRKLANVYCPVGSLSAYQTALSGKGKTITEYDFETDSLGLLDKEKEWKAKTSSVIVYPKYYTEKDEPENNVVFTDMTDALAYQCPWVGMRATIGGDIYIFDSNNEWVEAGYIELDYLVCGDGSSNGGLQLIQNVTSDYYFEVDAQNIQHTDSLMLIGQKSTVEAVSYQLGLCYYSHMFLDYGGGRLNLDIGIETQKQRHVFGAGHISGSTNPNVIGVTMDGTVVSGTNGTAMVENLPYLMCGVRYTGHTAADVSSNGSASDQTKIFSVKIYTDYGDTLVGDYIPVIRGGDNVVTLYDKISGRYATPYGSVIAGS